MDTTFPYRCRGSLTVQHVDLPLGLLQQGGDLPLGLIVQGVTEPGQFRDGFYLAMSGKEKPQYPARRRNPLSRAGGDPNGERLIITGVPDPHTETPPRGSSEEEQMPTAHDSDEANPREVDSDGAGRTVNTSQAVGMQPELNPPRAIAPRNRKATTLADAGGARGRKRPRWWTDQECNTLRALCEERAKIDWSRVCREFNSAYPERTIASLKAKYRALQLQSQSGAVEQGEETADRPPDLNGQDVPQERREVEEAVTVLEEVEHEVLLHHARTLSEESTTTAIELERPDTTRSISPDYSDSLNSELEVPDDFRDIFLGYYRWSQRTFDRRPLRRVPWNCHFSLFLFANEMITKEVQKPLRNQSEWGRLNALVYAAGRTIYQLWRTSRDENQRAANEWYRGAQKQSNDLRYCISVVERELDRRRQRRKPARSEILSFKKVARILKTRSSRMLSKRVEWMREKLSLLQQRVMLRKEEVERKRLRRAFKNTPSLRTLQPRRSSANERRPDMQSVLQFWEPIIGVAKPSNPDGQELFTKWREEIADGCSRVPEITDQYLEEVIDLQMRKAKPWKAAGPDGIYAYWWKNLSVARMELKKLIKKSVTLGRIPHTWLCRGRTVLLYKKGDSMSPSNYRPITCLNTCYKMVTAVLNKIMLRHLTTGGVLSQSQRALHAGDRGCIHALLLDKALVLDSKSQCKHPLSVAWLDFAKAYDSVSHSYLRWVLQSVQLPQPILKIIFRLMSGWSTRFQLTKGGLERCSDGLRILNGVYQGDSLSPTLFVLAITPISYGLNRVVKPCKSASGSLVGLSFKLGHLFYMDDLKLYARSPQELETQLNTVASMARVIGLSLNVEKCAQLHYDPRKGELQEKDIKKKEVVEQGQPDVPIMGFNSTYRYLGVEQRLVSSEKCIEKAEALLFERAREIFSSPLTWNQMRSAYAQIALGPMRYIYQASDGARLKLDATLLKARRLDIKVRDLLTKTKARFRSSCVDRLYVPGRNGGMGLMSIEDCLQESIITTWAYAAIHPDLTGPYYLFQQMSKRGKRTPVSDAVKTLGGFELVPEVDVRGRKVTVEGITFDNPRTLSRYLWARIRQTKTDIRLGNWKRLPMAGQFLQDPNLDVQGSSLWLDSALLSPRVIRDALSVQEATLLCRGSAGALREENKTCRWCRAPLETAEHIVSHCPKWLPSLYVERHNAVARNLHFLICQDYGLQITHYTNTVPPVLENDRAKVLWDCTIQTRQKMDHRKPDIVVFDKEIGGIVIVEFAVSHPSTMLLQKRIKENRYTVNSLHQDDETVVPYPPGVNLAADMQAVHKTPVHFLPVIVGVCGEQLKTTAEDLRRAFKWPPKKVPGLMERMSRSAAIGTARIVRAHLSRTNNTIW